MASTTPKKPRSATGKSRSATPASGKSDGALESRKERRKRARELKETKSELPHSNGVENAEASCSKLPSPNEPGFGEEDYIAFVLSDAESDKSLKDVVVEEAAVDSRRGDKGKGKAREYEWAGRKRKSDEIDFNDGYANKKERMAANSRLAPWAKDVDWENCHNVAEMYVYDCFTGWPCVHSDTHSQAASRSRRLCEVHVTDVR